jgi:serine phosphatase RsbU (regulator of sigma subunit)
MGNLDHRNSHIAGWFDRRVTSPTSTPPPTPLHAAVLAGGEATADTSRLAQLQIVTALLAGARTVSEVAGIACTTVAGAVGASRSMLATLSTDRRVLDVVRDDTDSGPMRVGLDEALPLAEAARTGLAVVLRNEADRARFPLLPESATEPLQVTLPLTSREGVVGVAGFRWSDRTALDADDVLFLNTVALQLGQALERARLHDASVQTAQLLQSTLLPSLIPPTPGLQIAARYQPVDDGAVVGGDFYDVFRRGDGRSFGLSIGDVSGKGVRAASLTALARHTIRAASRRGSSAANVLAELNDAILADDSADRYLTVAHLILQPEQLATKVTLSLGGHPQPFLRSADGSVRSVGQPGSAVGLLERGQWTDDHLTLAAGNILVLYTDGLTDVRDPATGELAGDLIADVLAGSSAKEAESLADELLAAVLDFGGGTRRDDMALLVLFPTA